MLKEADIVEVLRASFAASKGVIGIGDDAAVLPFSATESYVVTKDILVEHRHFRLSTTDAASLAHKALHVNLSDIAAMGTKPLFVLMGIAIPPATGKEWVNTFLTGFSDACKKENVALIGGDTTASERDLFISVTVIGKTGKKYLKFRNTAKAGDAICVAGALGEAHAGLMALEKNIPGLDAVKEKALRPTARTAEGIWLGGQSGVTAMMDVSDGLYVDLTRMVEASKTGAVIDVESLQPSVEMASACDTLKLDPLECMLAGGEDYGLLLTVEASAFEKTARDFEKQFGYRLQKIGSVTAGAGVALHKAGQKIAFVYRPFSHFGEM